MYVWRGEIMSDKIHLEDLQKTVDDIDKLMEVLREQINRLGKKYEP